MSLLFSGSCIQNLEVDNHLIPLLVALFVNITITNCYVAQPSSYNNHLIRRDICKHNIKVMLLSQNHR